ncbi:MAG: DUF4922 domain-containing protein [Bacteroidales bacterium]|nr:DUF4922 domain-containing protein [Bacteroidales bacterium]
MGDYKKLFKDQCISWDLAANNYRTLSKVLFKEFQIDHFRIKLQFNPGRITSSSANISMAAIQVRPCFLCAKNRPAEQDSLTIKANETSGMDFQVLVNPFPVFPQHYTIAATEHQPQAIKGHFHAFLKLAKSMNDCVVFYNGPRCGASAPDHLHFQAGSKGLMPVETDYDNWEKILLWKKKETRIYTMADGLRNGWIMEGNHSTELENTFEQLLDILPSANPASGEEPMLNLLCWYDQAKWICLVFPRKSHRPECYFKDDNHRLLISPASVEMGGLMIAARQEDFERIKEEDIRKIYQDVSVSKNEIDQLSEKWIEKIKSLI